MPVLSSRYINPQEYRGQELEAEERHEYFDGRIVAVPNANETHGRIAANIIGEIGSFVKHKAFDVFGPGCRVVTPTANAYMYPDISIICGKFQKEDDTFDTCVNPSVIIEVMSNATKNKDQGYKFFYYIQIPSLQEYLLVDSTNHFEYSICKQGDDLWKF